MAITVTKIINLSALSKGWRVVATKLSPSQFSSFPASLREWYGIHKGISHPSQWHRSLSWRIGENTSFTKSSKQTQNLGQRCTIKQTPVWRVLTTRAVIWGAPSSLMSSDNKLQCSASAVQVQCKCSASAVQVLCKSSAGALREQREDNVPRLVGICHPPSCSYLVITSGHSIFFNSTSGDNDAVDADTTKMKTIMNLIHKQDLR